MTKKLESAANWSELACRSDWSVSENLIRDFNQLIIMALRYIKATDYRKTLPKSSILGVILWCLLFAGKAFSDDNTNTLDLVAFFKQAINTPPDVEQYIVSQRDVQRNTLNYYVGARSGSNYFMKVLASSNALQNLGGIHPIAGRSGSNSYEFSQNAVSFGNGSNTITMGVWTYFTMTRQFLNMGVAEVKSESVKWSGNTFTATDDRGNYRQGELTTSNGLPSRLELSNARGPYKVIEYIYPDPPASFSGFPLKMRVSGESAGKLDLEMEVLFHSIRPAKDGLAESFFSAAQFVVPGIAHTNVYDGTNLFVQNRLGKMIKAPDSLTKSGGFTNSR